MQNNGIPLHQAAADGHKTKKKHSAVEYIYVYLSSISASISVISYVQLNKHRFFTE